LGRLAATIAEISFSAQFVLFIVYKLGDFYHHFIAQCFAIALVPAITVAQIFWWWRGGLSLNDHFYHDIEESSWAVAGGLIGFILITFACFLHHAENETFVYLGIIGCVVCVVSFAFVVMVEVVPTYRERSRHGTKNGS